MELIFAFKTRICEVSATCNCMMLSIFNGIFFYLLYLATVAFLMIKEYALKCLCFVAFNIVESLWVKLVAFITYLTAAIFIHLLNP